MRGYKENPQSGKSNEEKQKEREGGKKYDKMKKEQGMRREE